jgi:CxxC motif-containing protein
MSNLKLPSIPSKGGVVMEKRDLICISCPIGCSLEIEIIDECNIKVKGNSCNRGEIYGIKECTNPTRIITSTVFVKNGAEDVVSVKTHQAIPKEKIFDCIRLLKDVVIEAPVKIGDIIIANILGSEVNIVATKNIDKK